MVKKLELINRIDSRVRPISATLLALFVGVYILVSLVLGLDEFSLNLWDFVLGALV